MRTSITHPIWIDPLPVCMSRYEVALFEMTPEFISAWNVAGAHLNLGVRDASASWLRADLPSFREHLSFALGNQIFFTQISDHNAPDNGWMQPSRLAMAIPWHMDRQMKRPNRRIHRRSKLLLSPVSLEDPE